MLKRFIVERDIKGIGELSSDEYRFVAREFNAAASIIPGLQWLHTYVMGDKVRDIFLAESRELIIEHSLVSGMPVSRVEEVAAVIDPSTESRIQEDTGVSTRETVETWFAGRQRALKH